MVEAVGPTAARSGRPTWPATGSSSAKWSSAEPRRLHGVRPPRPQPDPGDAARAAAADRRWTRAERAVVLAKALGAAASSTGSATPPTSPWSTPTATPAWSPPRSASAPGIWLPGLGVHLNSMLGEGELNIGDLAPGDRISSMMCPLVVLDERRRPRASPPAPPAPRGSGRLCCDTLIAVLVDGMNVPEAVARPAPAHRRRPRPRRAGLPARRGARHLPTPGSRSTAGPQTNHYFGGVSAIGVTGASGDPRRDGAAACSRNASGATRSARNGDAFGFQPAPGFGLVSRHQPAARAHHPMPRHGRRRAWP